MQEVWKDIKDYEGLYSISNLGSVKSHRKGIILKGDKVNGYLRVDLYGINKKRKFIHRLVLEAFIGESNKIVNHKNGNKIDNRLVNLEYCTFSENNKHAYDIGLKKPLLGSDHQNSKLKESDIIEIFKLRDKGLRQYEIAKIFNTDQSRISRILNKKQWNHVKVGDK